MGVENNRFITCDGNMPVNISNLFSVSLQSINGEMHKIIFISTSNCTVSWSFSSKQVRDKMYKRVTNYQLKVIDINEGVKIKGLKNKI